MNGETSKPRDGERLSDIPWGDMKAIIDKLAEERLPRGPFERLATDYSYRREVVNFMCVGYDQMKRSKDDAGAKAERIKNRHRFQCSGSGYGDTTMEKFCADAVEAPDRFLRTLAFSLVYSVAYVNRGNGESTLSQENVSTLHASLPLAKEELPAKTPGGVIAAWGLVAYCRSACEHFFAPDAFFRYADKSHSGLHHGLREALIAYWQCYEEDPALLLQILATDFCKLLMGNSLDKEKAESFFKLFDKLGHNRGTPEIDSGLLLNQYCKTVFEWVVVQGKYPDFSLYLSPELCCGRMYRLYCRINDMYRFNLSGRLSKGISMYAFENRQKQQEEEEVYFDACPFCRTKLYTPSGAKLFDSSRDSARMKIYRD